MLHILSLIGVLLLMVFSFLAGVLFWIAALIIKYGGDKTKKILDLWTDTIRFVEKEDDPDDSEIESAE